MPSRTTIASIPMEMPLCYFLRLHDAPLFLHPSEDRRFARLGRIDTPRGAIRTPAFMPVGTAGTVKGIFPEHAQTDRHRHHPRQYLSSDAAADGGTYRGSRRASPIHRLGSADPHRFRRLPGDVACQAAKAVNERGVIFQSHLDGMPPRAHARNAPWKFSDCLAPTSRCNSMNASNIPIARRRRSARCACRSPGRRARDKPSAVSRGEGVSASCRAGHRKLSGSSRCIGLIEHRLRRLCDRRAGRGRGSGADAEDARLHRARAARRQAALSHGGWNAGRHLRQWRAAST